MKQNLRFLLCFVLWLGMFTPNLQAQELVNYEETWQEFLRNPLTSSISKLRKPDKGQVANYLKFSLMYATKFFCADNLTSAKRSIMDIESMGAAAMDKVPGFEERFDDLKVKVKAYYKCNDHWVNYLTNQKVSIKDLEANEMAKKVCEKGTLSKYFVMTTYDYYCGGDLGESREHFENRVLKLAKTSFNPKDVGGLQENIDQFKKSFEGITLLDKNWTTYIESNKSPGYDFDLPVVACYPIPNMKAYILQASVDVCQFGDEMLDKIKKLEGSTDHKIPADLNDKIQWLEAEVTKKNQELEKINKVWASFTSSEKVPADATYGYEFPCDREADVKAQLLDGYKDYCTAGQKALDNIEKIKKEFNPDMTAVTREKHARLKDLVAKEDARVAKLATAWKDFLPDNELTNGVNFEFKYCDIVNTIKAYIMDGANDKCAKGKQRLADIAAAREKHNPELNEEVLGKIEWLKTLVEKETKELDELNAAWKTFEANSKVEADAKYAYEFPCDREADVKAQLLDGYKDYCTAGRQALDNIKTIQEKYKPTLSAGTQSKQKALAKLVETNETTTAKIAAEWKKFEDNSKVEKSATYAYEFPCNRELDVQAQLLDGYKDYCTAGRKALDNIETIQEKYSPTLSTITEEKYTALVELVETQEKDTEALTTIWKEFLPNDEVGKDAEYAYEFPCNREMDVQAQLLDGYKDYCNTGRQALDNIKTIKSKYKPTLSSTTDKKHKALINLVENEEGNIATLNAAWKDFVPDNKLEKGINFVFKYCDIVPTIKAYIMDGITNRCAKSRQRLADIKAAREEHNPELSDEVIEKIDYLQKLVDEEDKDMADLGTAWDLFIEKDQVSSWSEGFPQKDTIIRDSIRLVEFYCDKIAQTKSWCIKGHLDPCTNGESFVKKIDALKKSHSLKYDKELDCRVERLRSKVYQCKYWALVLEARKITHEEREVFGPQSSEEMRVDLNSKEQPCETKVVYEPIGFIGVKYVISTFMCQKINLAKMGDPLYYKKIAKWVDTKVLTKYCEKSMRCKEDFFIYLEGHTDGYRFKARSYDRALGIPEGTPFTHFEGKENGTVDTLKKETRAIEKSLNSNMELGLARAWTVKEQLEFMQVPIEVGMYEHPENEKGGEYRKVDIELNITNLLLDFYEKTLKRLVKESGIGDRPKECQD